MNILFYLISLPPPLTHVLLCSPALLAIPIMWWCRWISLSALPSVTNLLLIECLSVINAMSRSITSFVMSLWIIFLINFFHKCATELFSRVKAGIEALVPARKYHGKSRLSLCFSPACSAHRNHFYTRETSLFVIYVFVIVRMCATVYSKRSHCLLIEWDNL